MMEQTVILQWRMSFLVTDFKEWLAAIAHCYNRKYVKNQH